MNSYLRAISDSSCDFASPLVIVNKKDNGIRVAVDYQVNMQLESMVNQFLYQSTLFQRLGGQRFYAKVDNWWGYHELRLTKDSSKSQPSSLHGGVHFLTCPFGISTAPGEYQARMAHEILNYLFILKDYYLNGAIVYIDDTNSYLHPNSSYCE